MPREPLSDRIGAFGGLNGAIWRTVLATTEAFSQMKNTTGRKP